MIYSEAEPWVPEPADEPYLLYTDTCVDCGGPWLGTFCERCGLSESDIADRLTQA